MAQGTVNVAWEKWIKLFSPVEICIQNPQYNLQSAPLLYSTIKGADIKWNKTDLSVRHISRFDYDGEKAAKHFGVTQAMSKGLWWHWTLNWYRKLLVKCKRNLLGESLPFTNMQ